MSRKSFLPVTYASSMTFDADQSKNFQTTLTGSPSVVIAGGQEGDEVSILFVQGGSGGYTVTFPSNVSWASGQKPNFNSAVGGTDLITLVKKGSTWQDKAGAPAKLPSRIIATALGTVMIVGSGITGVTMSLSRGNGQSTGNLPSAFRVVAGSGSETLALGDGSGSYLTGKKGGFAVGVGTLGTDRIDANSNSGSWLPNGTFRTRGTMSGAKLTVNATSAGSGKVVVHGSDGGGECFQDSDGAGWTTCEYLNGVQRCVIASAATCP